MFGHDHGKKKLCAKVAGICLKAPAGALLVDSFDRIVGTPEPQGYDELALYAYSDTQARLERYTDGGLPTEQKRVYLVPIKAAHEALTAVFEAKMDTWNDLRDADALCGRSCVCRFRGADGGYIRVSTEHMPRDGMRAFDAVAIALGSYLRDEYLQP